MVFCVDQYLAFIRKIFSRSKEKILKGQVLFTVEMSSIRNFVKPASIAAWSGPALGNCSCNRTILVKMLVAA